MSRDIETRIRNARNQTDPIQKWLSTGSELSPQLTRAIWQQVICEVLAGNRARLEHLEELALWAATETAGLLTHQEHENAWILLHALRDTRATNRIYGGGPEIWPLEGERPTYREVCAWILTEQPDGPEIDRALEILNDLEQEALEILNDPSNDPDHPALREAANWIYQNANSYQALYFTREHQAHDETPEEE